MTDIEKMTQKSQQAMQAAAAAWRRSFTTRAWSPEHLFFELISQEDGS